MTYQVVITTEALASAENFVNFIADERRAPNNAERWWRKALSLVDNLAMFPNRYPLAPENEFRDYTIRMLIVDSCLFLYVVDEESKIVRVIGFRHGSQQPFPEGLPD
jgi:plasmid stabilization system protein ParE